MPDREKNPENDPRTGPIRDVKAVSWEAPDDPTARYSGDGPDVLAAGGAGLEEWARTTTLRAVLAEFAYRLSRLEGAEDAPAADLPSVVDVKHLPEDDPRRIVAELADLVRPDAAATKYGAVVLARARSFLEQAEGAADRQADHEDGYFEDLHVEPEHGCPAELRRFFLTGKVPEGAWGVPVYGVVDSRPGNVVAVVIGRDQATAEEAAQGVADQLRTPDLVRQLSEAWFQVAGRSGAIVQIRCHDEGDADRFCDALQRLARRHRPE